ncbi:DsbA family oxidoreductase [Peribacillus loiseleuriae]|uniref:DsbA family oxidoreductase n=1 Tax=Peribacillus loiseleuriae TaxID=1679170 RepID=UPI003D0446E5
MRIEVWSDIACPFCYIGKRKLEGALAQFSYKEQVEVEFKSFELDPNAPLYNGKSFYEGLSSKYGMSSEKAKQFTAGIGQQAANVGLTFNFDEMKPTNTFDAHRLTKLAKLYAKEAAITEKLLYAYFTESKDVGNIETLADIAEASGLERQEALRVLNDKTLYVNDVRSDEADAKRYGISGVPYFIINQKYTISGAQPTETFAEALQKVWEEENPAPKLENLSSDSGDGAFCADGSCMVPPRKQ